MSYSRAIVGLVGISLLLILIASGYLAFFSVLGDCSEPPATVTDVRRYVDIRNQWPDSLADHFPAAILSGATEVRLSFFPGFLQGGRYFQVHMCLPPEQVAAIDAKFAAAASHRFQGGDTNDHMNAPGGVPTTFYHTSETGEFAAFPDSFTIYVLKFTPAGTPDFEWNHGSNTGVAVSRSSNEVVYWCGTW